MSISELPFYHGSSISRLNGGFPNSHPFEIKFDKTLSMFRLIHTEKLEELLNKVYLSGSLVDGSISNESGDVYVSQLVNYLVNYSQINKNNSILEIGFGTGIILKELKNNGFVNLKGIEPGNHELLEGMDGIEIINGFFPHKKINDKQDLIYHFAVWEHIFNPVEFIANQLNFLSTNGRIVFGVPNCEPYINEGDVSVFLHEHFNYFTIQSILSVVNKAGGKLIDIRVIEGMLVGTIVNKDTKLDQFSEFDFKLFDENVFWEKVQLFLRKLKFFFSQYENKKDIAIYVPGRSINSLFLLGINNVRLVDDNSEMHGRFLPTLINQIESFEDLCINPPKTILIYSKTFGEKIKLKCIKEKRLSQVKVATLNDI